jgi:integrase
MKIIEGLPRVGAGLLFPAQRAGSDSPVSGFARIKVRIDQMSGVTGWRLHDLRRTAASGMAQLGHPPHVVSRILNHSPGAIQGITSVYVRYSYAKERRAALADWGREIERIVVGTA